jgi:hypothetical protein
MAVPDGAGGTPGDCGDGLAERPLSGTVHPIDIGLAADGLGCEGEAAAILGACTARELVAEGELLGEIMLQHRLYGDCAMPESCSAVQS